MSLHDKFVWPKANHEVDETIFRNVRQHGCHIVDIVDATPAYAFSVGLYLNYGHPELIIFGLPDGAGSIINNVRNRAAAGHIFADGDKSDDLLEEPYRTSFRQVPYLIYPEYLGTALWFYWDSNIVFPCLQIVWSDQNGRFPWEVGCLPHVKERQPLLKTVS